MSASKSPATSRRLSASGGSDSTRIRTSTSASWRCTSRARRSMTANFAGTRQVNSSSGLPGGRGRAARGRAVGDQQGGRALGVVGDAAPRLAAAPSGSATSGPSRARRGPSAPCCTSAMRSTARFSARLTPGGAEHRPRRVEQHHVRVRADERAQIDRRLIGEELGAVRPDLGEQVELAAHHLGPRGPQRVVGAHHDAIGRRRALVIVAGWRRAPARRAESGDDGEGPGADAAPARRRPGGSPSRRRSSSRKKHRRLSATSTSRSPIAATPVMSPRQAAMAADVPAVLVDGPDDVGRR